MPLSTSNQKPPSTQHIQWTGTNQTEIAQQLGGASSGWAVTADGATLHLTGGPQGDLALPTGTWIVGPQYWGANPPPFALSEVLADTDFQGKYGI
ncbi:hypothetical protein ACFORO_12585 [Amycolatopsis halotolerans]|uniref:Uncharacterized protein n=1 Tax=Amycolatopsis halotolerans TaxID=330083 RepID=A0ABV7QCE7_9PSEU